MALAALVWVIAEADLRVTARVVEARLASTPARGPLSTRERASRGVLEALLDGPIVCTPVDRTYEMRAPLAVPEALGFRSGHVPSGI